MKKLFALFISMVLFASSIPMENTMAAQAEETKAVATEDAVKAAMPIRAEEPIGSVNEPTKEALERAIKAVKAKITIPKEYSEFDYYFYDGGAYTESYWRLSWRKPEDGSRIYVNCDQDNNIISYYSKYDYSKEQGSIPNYLKKELKTTADAFIKQIALKLWTRLEYVDATYDGIYSGSYTYSYRRVENGVIFPDNVVTVSVDGVTGEVTSASIQWLYDAEIPSSKIKLTKEDAVKLLKENMEMKLVYRTSGYRYYEDGNNSTQAYLVYEPTKSYISVDAKTGEVYLTRSEWVERSDNGSKEAPEQNDSSADEGAASLPLTEEEIAKIKELEKLISKEAAIQKVTKNQYLYLDKNLKTYSATLNKSSKYNSKESSYVWNISLSDPREINYENNEDNYRANAYAQVDAKTGKILSFYASIKDQFDEKTGTWKSVKIPYDKEEARVVLEKFLKSQTPSRFQNSILVDQNEDYVAYYKEKTPIYGGYYYTYHRVNEGVEYPYNGIYGSVDGVTGKIYSYHTNWDDNVVFESPKGAITPEKAMDYYLSKDGFELKYEVNVIQSYDPSIKEELYDYNASYQVEYEVRLVYRPDINPYYIDPFTGEQLDYSGEVYMVTKPYSYLDINDTPENRDILLLADMNIGFEGEYFKPSQVITGEELVTLMDKLGYGAGNSNVASDRPISREEIAWFFISRLGLDSLSKLPGIYQTGYTDENSIDPAFLGAVALAKGLKLMEADTSLNFNPKAKVTRAQAVRLIMNFIEVSRDGILY